MGDALVLGIEIAKEAGARAKALAFRHGERKFVDMRRDAPHRLAAAFRDEQLHPRMAEERVLVRIDQLKLLGADLRDEIGQAVGESTAQVDERCPLMLAGDRFDLYLA